MGYSLFRYVIHEPIRDGVFLSSIATCKPILVTPKFYKLLRSFSDQGCTQPEFHTQLYETSSSQPSQYWPTNHPFPVIELNNILFGALPYPVLCTCPIHCIFCLSDYSVYSVSYRVVGESAGYTCYY